MRNGRPVYGGAQYELQRGLHLKKRVSWGWCDGEAGMCIC